MLVLKQSMLNNELACIIGAVASWTYSSFVFCLFHVPLPMLCASGSLE
jgi:hypothetical protein